MAFRRLIRFIGVDGNAHFGDVDDAPAAIGEEAEVLDGDLDIGFKRTGRREKIEKLLCPLPRVPQVICIGLNYMQHAREANLKIPVYPVVFTKPADALTGPNDDVHIHADAQSQLDYEGELTVVIGRDAKNISEADALDYVLGYSCGNDISARNFQIPADVSGGQFGYAKSFDGFAPTGPCILAADKAINPQSLQLTTRVNGQVRQQTNTSDMIFSVAKIIAHLTRGTTLRKGTIIQTGTPSGVGLFMEPKGFLKDGDVVEVEVEGIGATRNTMVFV